MDIQGISYESEMMERGKIILELRNNPVRGHTYHNHQNCALDNTCFVCLSKLSTLDGVNHVLYPKFIVYRNQQKLVIMNIPK